MSHGVFERWLREGRPEADRDVVNEHLSTCETCRRELRHVDEVRSWFVADGAGLATETADAIRFRLQTEARLRNAPAPQRSPRRRAGWALLAAAAAASFGLAWFARSGGEAVEPAMQVIVRGDPSARVVRREASRNDRVYVVREGIAWFAVRPLEGRQRVRVFAGGDVVEVRGTRFGVRVDNGTLQAVRVLEGKVALRIVGQPERMLTAGERWDRPRNRRGPSTGDTPRAARAAPGPSSARAASERVEERPLPSFSPNDPYRAVDVAFAAAWKLYREGQFEQAASAFDRLFSFDLGAREADVLFWSARSHAAAGHVGRARDRLEALEREHANSWHTPAARALRHRLDAAPAAD